MTTDRRIAANRINARLSTGPRTSAGKTKVSGNALKHGLTGQAIVLANENPDEFDSFRDDLLSSLDPHGALEATLVEKIILDCWRLRRIPVLEAAVYRRGHLESVAKETEESVRQYESTEAERSRS